MLEVQATSVPRQQVPTPPSAEQVPAPTQQSVPAMQAPPSREQHVRAAPGQSLFGTQQSKANRHLPPGAEQVHAPPSHAVLQHSPPAPHEAPGRPQQVLA